MAKRNGTPNYALREARARGDKFYQPDFFCNNGHMTKRLTSSGACYECHRATSNAGVKKLRASPAGEEFRAKKRLEQVNWYAKPENSEKRALYARRDREKFGKRSKDPEGARADQANMRAKKWGAEGSYTRDELKALLINQYYRCAECNKKVDGKYEADHKIPLKIGGTNFIGNIQILCLKCNRCKSCLNPKDWQFVKEKMKRLAVI